MFLRRLTDWPTTGWANPFDEFERIRRQMDILSDAFSGGRLREPVAGVFPLVNITEDGENYYVRAEIPGIKADELEISATGDSLSISGERKISDESEKATYHRRERDAGRFSRVVRLPGQIDTGKVEAGCTDGVLTVTLPKAEETKPRQISVKTS